MGNLGNAKTNFDMNKEQNFPKSTFSHPILSKNRSVRVIDNAVAKDSVTSRLKVEDGNDLQVGAPMKGEVLDIKVAMGEVVEKGQGKK